MRAFSSTTVPDGIRRAIRSPGRPLPAALRASFEPRFGYDFSRVRIHADTEAATASARAVDAAAYTVGSDIVFGAGRYDPGSAAGMKVLAHELTHVVQQGPGAGASRAIPDTVADRNSPAERAAASAVEQFSAQTPLSSLTSHAAPAVFRQPADEAPADRSTFAGLCARSPLGPGRIRFNGCSVAQLGDYAVMPEGGTTLTTPVNGVWYDADGYWYRYHHPRNEWFKVGDHCDNDVTCAGSGPSNSSCCNAAASLIKGRPRWVSDSHATTNPF
jgi:hypothetical protein